MHNWDYPKDGELVDERWRMERLLTYGLGGEKLNAEMVKRYVNDIKIPDDTRAFIELLLWNKAF